jgi:hypothetical protein
MSLSKKYGIPQEKIDQLVKDGVISCSWPRHEDIYRMFQETRAATGKSTRSIAYEISAKTNLSVRTVQYIIEKLS